MTKPVIVTRLGKGSELTFQEGDDNFTNLRDATVTVAGDSGTSQAVDLNGTITVAGGTGLSTAMTTGTVTVNLDNTAVTAGSYTNADITVDAQGRVTSASNGSPGYDDADARAAISVTDAGGDGSVAYNSSTGVITYTGPSASEVRAHISAGTGISITDGAISSTITQYTDANAKAAITAGTGITVTEGVVATTITQYTDADARSSLSASQNLTYNSSTGAFTGPDLSGYQTSLGFTAENSANKNQNNGYAGLDSNGKVASAQLPSYVDDVIEVANYEALPGSGETGKIYVTLDINKVYRWSGSTYVEVAASPGTTDNVPEGTTNQYFTTQRARDAFSASTGISITNGAISTTITQYTDSAARSAISVTDNGGDGSLSYNSSTGAISYTGPSASEVRAHFSAGTGITITDGVVASTVSAGISDIISDTTPQLGGNLDVNGNSIVSVSNGNIAITPNGTGSIVLDGLNWPQSDGSADQVLKTNGSGQLSWATAGGGGGAPAVAIAYATNMTSTSTPASKCFNFSNEVSDISNMLSYSNGVFTITGAGTYMIDLYGIYGNSDPNAMVFKDYTTDSNLVYMPAAEIGSGSNYLIANFSYVHTFSGSSNSYYISQTNTGAINFVGRAYLRITKLA